MSSQLAITQVLRARVRIGQELLRHDAEFRGWAMTLRESHWEISGPDWLRPYNDFLAGLPAESLDEDDLSLILRLQTRCGYQRMLDADRHVARTSGARLASINDFTYHQRPEIYYTEPDHIRVRKAYANIAAGRMKTAEHPMHAVTRVELFSRKMFEDFSDLKKVVFACFLIEQIVDNGFDVYIVDKDDVQHPVTDFDIFDNHVVLLEPGRATKVWTSSSSEEYPCLTTIDGKIETTGANGSFGRVIDYGKSFGVPLKGFTANQVCGFLGIEPIEGIVLKSLKNLSSELTEQLTGFASSGRARTAIRNYFIKEMIVGDKYDVAQAAAVGPNSRATGTTMTQTQSSNFDTLANQLRELRLALSSDTDIQGEKAEVVDIVQAEAAAREGDSKRVTKHLSQASKRVLKMAEKIGADVVASAIKGLLNS